MSRPQSAELRDRHRRTGRPRSQLALSIFSKHSTQSVRDLPYTRICLDRLKNWSHEVLRSTSRLLQGVERFCNFRGIAFSFHLLQGNNLLSFNRWVQAVNRNRIAVLRFKSIDTNDNTLARFDGFLVLIRSLLNFALNVSTVNCGKHPAHAFNSVQVLLTLLLNRVRQRLQRVRTAKRIGDVSCATFPCDHLLRLQCQTSCLLRRKRKCLVA